MSHQREVPFVVFGGEGVVIEAGGVNFGVAEIGVGAPWVVEEGEDRSAREELVHLK